MKTLIILSFLLVLTSCGVTHELVVNVNYQTETTTDSTIIRVSYDSTVLKRIDYNK